VTSAAWAPDGESFVTGSLDSQAQLCHWGIRSAHPFYVWTGGFRVQDCAITPDGSRLIAADETGGVHVYNYKTHVEEYCLPLKSKVTSVSVSKDSRYVLINLAEGQIQLVDLETTEMVRRYRGQKQGEFVIRSGFGGAAESFVISGSEGKLSRLTNMIGLALTGFDSRFQYLHMAQRKLYHCRGFGRAHEGLCECCLLESCQCQHVCLCG